MGDCLVSSRRIIFYSNANNKMDLLHNKKEIVMAQYIEKSALASEIENLENTYKKCPTRNSYEEGLKNGRLIGYKDVLHKINTLKTKEINLEKHLKEDIEDVFFDLDGVAVKGATHYITVEDVKYIAKHFFELGLLKTNNEI